jgi:hypothetical protein
LVYAARLIEKCVVDALRVYLARLNGCVWIGYFTLQVDVCYAVCECVLTDGLCLERSMYIVTMRALPALSKEPRPLKINIPMLC